MRYSFSKQSYLHWILVLSMAVAYVPSANSQDADHAIADSLQALQVREGFWIEPVAHEPLIVDPVSARLDYRGQLWVVEMPDYPRLSDPKAVPNGRVKVLRDTDDDGRFDHATTFADHLLFATGVQPFGNGAFVTLAGKIVYIADTDADGVGDQQTVLFEGFVQQNEQLRANHPTLGPDGRVYVAGGLRGGTITSVHPRYQPQSQAIELRDRDFAFNPLGNQWHAVAGNSQFGLSIDDFGRRIGCSNRNPAMTAAMELSSIQRDPFLTPRDAIWNVAAAGADSKVVSRGPAWTTSNLHSGQFSAACGVCAAGMEDAVGEWLLVCEPTSYAVQRQRIRPSGSVWESTREPRQWEFISSSDSWFRAVDVIPGPGQSLYIVDMARAVIEHPDFMPTELKTRRDLHDGDNLGRIWRVAPKNQDGRIPALTSVRQAISWLGSDSAWERQMGSQFLIETDEPIIEPLSELIQSSDSHPRAVARAGHLLAQRGELRDSDFAHLFSNSDARVRALAVQWSDPRSAQFQRCLALLDDPSLLVRRSLAEFLARDPTQHDHRVAGLFHLAIGTDDLWVRRIVASAHQDLIVDLAKRFAKAPSLMVTMLDHLIQRIAIDMPDSAADVLVTYLRRPEESVSLEQVTIFNGLITGLRRGGRSFPQWIQQVPTESRQLIESRLDTIAQVPMQNDAPGQLRAACLQLASRCQRTPADVRTLVDEHSPPELRKIAIPIAIRQDTPWMQRYLRDHMASLSIPIRNAAVQGCLQQTETATWLLSEIKSGTFPKGIIDPATAGRLRKHSNPDIRSLADALFRTDPDRAAVLMKYASSASHLGNARLGQALFLKHCAACHQIDGQGTNVGPDISDSRTKTPQSLLTAILDPNAAIDAAFHQYNVLTVDGRVIDGLLIDESTDAVVLQRKGGERVTIARQDIEQIATSGISLMPEGFEQTMDPESMSHLLSYLKNWRYLKTRIPADLPGSVELPATGDSDDPHVAPNTP